jgi:hypothetical protein
VTTENNRVFAKHPKKANLIAKPFSGGVLFTSIFGVQEAVKADRAGYLEFINKANTGAAVVRYYADADADFVIEGWYSGDYRQVDFGRFAELWDEDITKLADMPEAAQYLK